MTTFILARKPPADSQHPRDAARWLGLAASPTFALMTWISANDLQAMMCASGAGSLSIGGMAWMYLLMSLFHLSPWLRIATARSRQSTDTMTTADSASAPRTVADNPRGISARAHNLEDQEP